MRLETTGIKTLDGDTDLLIKLLFDDRQTRRERSISYAIARDTTRDGLDEILADT